MSKKHSCIFSLNFPSSSSFKAFALFFPVFIVLFFTLYFCNLNIVFIWQYPRSKAVKCEVKHGKNGNHLQWCQYFNLFGILYYKLPCTCGWGLNVLPIFCEKSKWMLTHFLCGTLKSPKPKLDWIWLPNCIINLDTCIRYIIYSEISNEFYLKP